MSIKRQDVHFCDFCGKNNHEVDQMIAGPKIDICSECIEIAWDIVKEQREKDDNENHAST